MIRRTLHIERPFLFEAGGQIDSMDIVYYTSEHERRPSDKVIWVCHALTGNADPVEWWGDLFSESCLFDAEKYYVVCVAMIGSSYGECGPASINPQTHKAYLLDFPLTTVRDMVRAGNLVREHLGIDTIDLMLGPSIGGFQTAEWLVCHPSVVKKAVLLATGVRATPYLTAFNESQRMAIDADPTFREARGIDGGREGLKCARSIALISYRTPAGYDTTQAESEEDTIFAGKAASYQRYQGKKLVDRGFDAYSYWYLTLSLDSMNLGRGRGGVRKALSSIQAECMVVSITSDMLFPKENLRMIAQAIPHATYHEIESIYGHDGFLIEKDSLVRVLQNFI